MAKKKLSRDQKRKQKLGKRLRPGGSGASRYTAQMEAFTHDTERGINEAFLKYGRKMHDGDVIAALNQLVVDVQKRNVAAAPASDEQPGAAQALVESLKQRWAREHTLETIPSLVAAQALQSVAQHVESISAPGDSHSYLRFLQGSMQSAGSAPDAVSDRVDIYSQGPIELPQTVPDAAYVGDKPLDGDWTPDEYRLIEVGLQWFRSSTPETWEAFRTAADQLNESGHAQEVANACQYLYGLTQAGPVEVALRPVLDAAHERLDTQHAESAE